MSTADELADLHQQLAEVKKLLSFKELELYKPYAKQLEFHSAGADANVRERLLIAGNQLGKGSPVDEPVLTPTGWVAIGELKVGDPVIAGDGSVTEVTGVFPRGVLPVIEVEFCYGAKVRVDPEHLWAVQTPQTRFRTKTETLYAEHGLGLKEARAKSQRKVKTCREVVNPRHGEWEVLTTAQMRAKYGDTPVPKYRYATPAVGTCQFDAQPTPIDPYVLGLLLGDGCLRNGVVSLASADKQMVDALLAEVEKRGGKLSQSQSRQYDHRVSFAPSLKADLEALGSMGLLSAQKRVPAQYLWNTPEVRLAVLQGLMDTDGTCEKSGVTTFTSISEGLAEDVQFLARSFGAKCKIKSRIPTFSYKGKKRQGQRAYTVVIRCPHVDLFRLERKLERYVRPTSTSDHNIIVGFKDLPPQEVVCISVSHPSKLYVTRDFIVTHNTLSASREAAMHATGLYPAWWPGAQFLKPTTGWAASTTSQGTRDTVQRMLLGQPGNFGTGAIPKDALVDVKKSTHGVADSVEIITCKHFPAIDNPRRLSDGTSRITLKTYDQGRERWQGDTLNWVWFDEEPPQDIYSEGLTRTNATGGIAFMTFTPLLGISDVVKRFLFEKPAGTHVTQMTIEDAEHYTPEQRRMIIAAYPAHERDARAKGIPILGSGRIFPFEDSLIAENPMQIPGFWPRIAGIDFGYDHPTAVAWMAWDRDTDTVHVYDLYRRREATPVVHAASIRARGLWIPVAWPHDGDTRDSRNSGVTLAQQYRNLGVNMLKDRATHAPAQGQKEGDGGNSLEASITDMYDRIQTGRFKVAKHLTDFFEEFRLYHRKDGMVVKENDDAISAVRMGLMMLRKATLQQQPREIIVPGFRSTVPGMGMLG